jgi:hypothetical protein
MYVIVQYVHEYKMYAVYFYLFLDENDFLTVWATINFQRRTNQYRVQRSSLSQRLPENMNTDRSTETIGWTQAPWWIALDFPTDPAGSNSNVPFLCLDDLFHCLQGHHFSWLTFRCYSLVSPGKCLKSTSNSSGNFFCKFPPNHYLLASPLYRSSYWQCRYINYKKIHISLFMSVKLWTNYIEQRVHPIVYY